ncbi:hypothetical protein [Halomicronema hongdechloris]|uniref:hypothetical protein n=1 Tax=Halomicronema hongdechloris TaxID=1209493 RepID=UPI0016518B51|nr:hypothetical protein [Halomicronema hongdechloris]
MPSEPVLPPPGNPGWLYRRHLVHLWLMAPRDDPRGILAHDMGLTMAPETRLHP